MEDQEIDEILASVEKESPERPMTADPSQPSQEGAAPASSQWNAKEWEFDWNGKKIAPDTREKLMTWASQGHNYSQRMAEVNRKEREFQQLGQKYQGYDRFNEMNDYAKQNPDWWAHVEQAWAQRDAQRLSGGGESQLDPQIASLLKPLQEELGTLRQWRETSEQERTAQEAKRADEALDADIQSTREKNSTIDFDAVDETGKTLETRVLEHAKEIGTTSFRVAYRDYCHDHIVESAKAQSLSAQAKTKTPALGTGTTATPTPRRQVGQVQVKGRSYDDLAREAAEEYGLQN